VRYVLFLDMDGVLNSHFHAVSEDRFPRPQYPLGADDTHEADMQRMIYEVDPRLLWNLGFVAKHVPDLEIVISSTWRNHFKLEQFQELFKRLGYPNLQVIGFTPNVAEGQKLSERVPRIAQIDQYRKDNNLEWSDCVILDDHSVAPNENYNADIPSRWMPEDKKWQERFVQTDGRDGFIYSRSWDVIAKFIGWEAFKPPIILM